MNKMSYEADFKLYQQILKGLVEEKNKLEIGLKEVNNKIEKTIGKLEYIREKHQEEKDAEPSTQDES